MIYDIALIGLGPAGSTFARVLDSRIKVIAIDKKSAEGGFKKPCGGLLSANAQKALSAFQLTLPKDILVDPQIFSVKTIDVPHSLVRHYQRFYINLDRHKFDLWLSSMLGENVDRFTGRVTYIEKTDGYFAVTCKNGSEETTFYAKSLVGADGANSLVRRTFFRKARIRSYVAIQQWFEERHATPFYSCIFDPETSDCCSWSISKDNSFIYGGAFAAKDSKLNFERQKKKMERLGFVFGEPIKTETCMVLRPSLSTRFQTMANGAFLIGEAAGFISPSSLEGISYGITSAQLLARLFNEGKEHRYHAKTFSIRLKIFIKVLKCPFMYHPLLRYLVMKSGITSIDVS